MDFGILKIPHLHPNNIIHSKTGYMQAQA